MILPIIGFGSSILRDKCLSINSKYPDLELLINNMWETMYASNGVGLAAPQINKSIRLFLVDTTPFESDNELDVEIVKQVFINPVIVSEEGDSWQFSEGCLSIPYIREDVSRKSKITIEYFDKEFNKISRSYSGIAARVIQHEYDHLNGVLFIDKISPLRKRMLKGNAFEKAL